MPNSEHLTETTLSAYADGELAGGELRRAESHLEACSTCADAVTELRALRSAIGALPRAKAPRSFRLREADVRGQKPSTPWTRWLTSPALAGVSMCAVVAFVVLLGADLLGGVSMSSSDSNRLTAFSERNRTPETVGEASSYDSSDAATKAVAPSAGLSETDGDQAVTDSPSGPTENGTDQGLAGTPSAPQPAATADDQLAEDGDDGGSSALHVAEAAAAAVALFAGTTYVIARRRAE